MKKIIISIIAFFALTGASFAGSWGIGASGSIAKVAADGTETTTAGTVAGGAANTNNKSVDEIGALGSLFLDYETDSGIVIGFSHVPMSGDVTGKTHSRTETAQGVSGADASGSITRTADAEVENFNTLYVEYPMGSYFAKLGWSQIDVNTKENVITDSGTYGNATLDGYTLGLGVNGSMGDFFTKTSVEYTDFEDLSLTSTTSNKISANLDVIEFKIAVGKRF
jgi:hypothetical protein|tara:strand:+ start:59 stop:730 length:672 start_codon:yes stop_codon:yes gene_type:complete